MAEMSETGTTQSITVLIFKKYSYNHLKEKKIGRNIAHVGGKYTQNFDGTVGMEKNTVE
jgi:hypothetical protein